MMSMDGPYPIHVLDDDPSVLRGLKRLLTAHGWDVRTYAGIDEFERSVALDEPGCLLLDLRMPGMARASSCWPSSTNRTWSWGCC